MAGSGATLLPSSNALDGAPVIGEGSDSNIIVRLANGLTLLQRLSPPCYRKVVDLRSMAPDGDRAKDALFKAASRSGLVSPNAIECGLSYHDGVHGWSAEHAQLAEEADTMLHWIWRYFHHHVYPLATLLDADLRVDLDRRRNPYDWFEKLMGPGQYSLTHHWWTSATVSRGEGAFTDGERVDTHNHQPAILVGFNAPFVLLVAHQHGFLKTVVRPGQVVIFRPEVPYRICPCEDERDVKSSTSADSTSRSTPQAGTSKPRRSKKKSNAQAEDGDGEFWTILLTFSNDIFNKTRPPKVALRQRLDPLPLQPDTDEQRRYAKHPRFARAAQTPFN